MSCTHIVDKILTKEEITIDDTKQFIEFVETFLHCEFEIEEEEQEENNGTDDELATNGVPSLEDDIDFFFETSDNGFSQHSYTQLPISSTDISLCINSQLVCLEQPKKYCPIPIIGTACHILTYVNLAHLSSDIDIPCYSVPIVYNKNNNQEEEKKMVVQTKSSTYTCKEKEDWSDDFSLFYLENETLHFIGSNHTLSTESFSSVKHSSMTIMQTIAYLTYHYYKFKYKSAIVFPQVLCNAWKHIPKKDFDIRTLLLMIANERKSLDLWQLKDHLNFLKTPTADEISHVIHLNRPFTK
jgi:hypothetical protein